MHVPVMEDIGSNQRMMMVHCLKGAATAILHASRMTSASCQEAGIAVASITARISAASEEYSHAHRAEIVNMRHRTGVMAVISNG